MPSLIDVAEQGGAATDPAYQAVAPYLAAFESIAAGSRLTDGLGVTRVTAGLGE